MTEPEGPEVTEPMEAMQSETGERVIQDLPMAETYSEDRLVSESSLQITDRGEIEELFGLLDFCSTRSFDSVFAEDYINVMSIMEDGSVRDWYLPQGALPEKYILRFGRQ